MCTRTSGRFPFLFRASCSAFNRGTRPRKAWELDSPSGKTNSLPISFTRKGAEIKNRRPYWLHTAHVIATPPCHSALHVRPLCVPSEHVQCPFPPCVPSMFDCQSSRPLRLSYSLAPSLSALADAIPRAFIQPGSAPLGFPRSVCRVPVPHRPLLAPCTSAITAPASAHRITVPSSRPVVVCRPAASSPPSVFPADVMQYTVCRCFLSFSISDDLRRFSLLFPFSFIV